MHITWSLVYIFVTISSQSLQRQNHFLWWFEPFFFLTYFATSLKKLYIVDLKICLNFIFKLILNPISFLVFKSPLHLIFLVHLPFNFILSLSLSHPYSHVTRPYPSAPPSPLLSPLFLLLTLLIFFKVFFFPFFWVTGHHFSLPFFFLLPTALPKHCQTLPPHTLRATSLLLSSFFRSIISPILLHFLLYLHLYRIFGGLCRDC